MKAFILAAGAGTRLGRTTEDCPKPMLEVAGRPLLEHTIRRLARYGVTDMIVNLHHAPDVIRSYFGDGRAWGVTLTYSFEATLRGTAGALWPWRDALGDAAFFVLYGDNLSTCRFDRLLDTHRSRGALATIALFHRGDTAHSGVAEVNAEGDVVRFVEKPAAGTMDSRWVNAGILVLDPAALAAVGDRFQDFGRDLLPAWIDAGRRVAGYRMGPRESLWWIDTPADLERVQRDLRGRTDL